MRQHILQKIGFAALLLVIALLSVTSVGTLTADAAAEAPAAEEAKEADYGWVYVANGVWHCDEGGSGGCSPQSAHSWIE